METPVPISCPPPIIVERNVEINGYSTPKGNLNQNILKEAEAVRENKRAECQRFSTTSSDYSVPISPSSRFPSSSPLIVISPPKDEATPITIIPSPICRSPMPDTHRRSLIIAIIAALLVFVAVIFMLLLVLYA